MNKYWNFLESQSLAHEQNRLQKSFTFSHDFKLNEAQEILEQSISTKILQSSTVSSVKVVGDYIVKKDVRPLRKRFKTARIIVDPIKGLQGPLGEAVNTLVANIIHYPSHKLLSLQYNLLKRQSILIFKRLKTDSVFEIINEHDIDTLLKIIIKFLHECLSKGIFHGDCNINNIFFDHSLKNGRFIDF